MDFQKKSISFLFLAIFTVATTSTTTTATTAATKTSFINSKCRATTYPKMCVKSLTYYTKTIKNSPSQMAQTALIVSLSKAHYAKTYMAQFSHTKGLRPNEIGVIKDCVEEINDTVDRLDKSVHEFKVAVRTRSRDFLWHMSNVQTWASAALTDLNTCVDEVKSLNWRVKMGILAQFQGVIQCTSNALSLVNQFANKYSP